jgi:putative membrane protein
VRRGAFITGLIALLMAWAIAAGPYAITGHMLAHMAAVAIAAPLIALGIAGTPWDPSMRLPLVVAPLPMAIVELLVVWGWHAPAARELAASSTAGLIIEQAMFVMAGLLLWSACIGASGAAHRARRAAGVIALLLTTMHMTLLGVLITLAPRTLFGTTGFHCFGHSVSPLADQQLGGVIMLIVGAGSYLAGGLLMLSRLMWTGQGASARQCL